MGVTARISAAWQATVLGWKAESNWTDPWAFGVFAVLRPLASALILVFMYRVIAGQQTQAVLDFLVIGSAVWTFAVNGFTGIAWTVLLDREDYKMLKYVYLSPMPFGIYLVARNAYRVGTGLVSFAAPVVVAMASLGLTFQFRADVLFTLGAAILIAAIGVVGFSLVIGGITLQFTNQAWGIPEALSLALYLICGVVFPLTVIPRWLAVIGESVPMTYWLEATRRLLLGVEAHRALPYLSDGEILLRAAGTGGAWVVLGVIALSWGLRRGRRLGLLDRESTF
jgi:ABC-2 type transport system permease protein